MSPTQVRINAQGWAGAEPTKKNRFLFVGIQNQCEGKDAFNFTVVGEQQSDAQCNLDSIVFKLFKLVINKAKGESAVIDLSTILAASSYPDGGQLFN